MERKTFVIKRPKVLYVKKIPSTHKRFFILYSSSLLITHKNTELSYNKVIYNRKSYQQKYPLHILKLFSNTNSYILEKDYSDYIEGDNSVVIYNNNNISIIIVDIDNNATDFSNKKTFISFLKYNNTLQSTFKNTLIENDFFKLKLKTLVHYSFLI